MSSSPVLLDAAGRRRSPAAMPGHNAGRPPRNKGVRYPADPPTVEEIVAVMRKIPVDRHGLRLRAMIVVLWRGGLRIQEALDLTESDLDARRGSILVRAGKGNKRREVGMDPWAWSDHLAPWVVCRTQLPLGPLFCVIDGATRGRPWSATAVRAELRRYALAAGVRRRFAPQSAPACSRGRDERNVTLNYRSVLARELTATDARLYGRTRRQRRSRRSTTDD
jgi:integrase